MNGLFDVNADQRIWTARSVLKIDVVKQDIVSDVIKIIIDRLLPDGMIP